MAFDAFSANRISFEREDVFQDGSITDAYALMGALGRPAGGFVGQNVSNSILIEHTQECCACGHDHGYELSIEKVGGTLDGVIVATPETDIAGDATTTASIAIGGTFVDEIEVSGDEDWIAVDLVAGTEYVFTLTGTGTDPLDDPYLELMDASGTMVAENDDGGSGLNSRLRFTADATGTFYLNAHGWVNSSGGTPTGEYTLTADLYEGLEDYTLDQAATFITDEFSTRSAYNNSLMVNGNQIIVYDVSGLTAAQANLAELAMEAWADVAAIDFMTAAEAQAANGGTAVAVDITYINTEDGAYNSNSTTSPINGTRVILSGTVNVNSTWNGSNTNFDSYTYQTYLHEVGHALGLGHAGPYNGNGAYDVDAIYAQDSWAYSVMSYFDQDESGYGDYRFVLGPQIVDVIAIQDLYGANPNGTRTGDSVYGFNSTETDVHDFSAFTRPPALTIYDTGGIDTLDMSGYTNAQVISLIPESFSDLGNRGSSDSYSSVISIARGTIIENAVGGSGNDLIIANEADNELTGNGGSDTFRITVDANGTDTITDFIANSDKLDLSLFDETVATDAFNQRVNTAEGTEITIGNQVILLEGVTASSLDLADVLFQSGSTDTLPEASNDTIETTESKALSGSVFSDNGNGTDSDADGDTLTVVSVQGSAGGVGATWSLSQGATITINADGTFVFTPGDGYRYLSSSQSISTQLTYTVSDDDGNTSSAVATFRIFGEDPLPTSADDELFGTNDDDNFSGLAGNDTIFGLLGDDILRGGEGNDTIDGGAGNDTIYGERDDDILIGGDGDDSIYASLGNDTLDGGDGNDRLDASSGDDTVDGGAGDDRIIGRDGVDTLNGGDGVDNITGGTGIDTINGDAGDDRIDGQDGNDIIYGGTGADRLIGRNGDDEIYGGDDNDNIDGSSGEDIIEGGLGDDRIDAGNDNDTVFGGEGNDRIQGRNGDDDLDGQDGNDSIDGNSGSDRLYGREGVDRLDGGNDDDFVYGHEGNDVLWGRDGVDRLEGGDGNDRMYGGDGNDRMLGGDGDDRIDGGTGNDNIDGGSGDDRILAGDGDDRIDGGLGRDIINGGAGADRFTYTVEAGSGEDYIYDYEAGVDEVYFVDSGFTSFADIQAAMTDSTNYVEITISGTQSIRLYGVTSADLTAADFTLQTSAEEYQSDKYSAPVVSESFDFENVEATDLAPLPNLFADTDIANAPVLSGQSAMPDMDIIGLDVDSVDGLAMEMIDWFIA